MRIKDGFILRSICGEYVVVGEGLKRVNFNKLLSLNASAAYLWEKVSGRDFTAEDMVDLLQEQYEVSAQQAAADVDKLLEVWTREGIVE